MRYAEYLACYIMCYNIYPERQIYIADFILLQHCIRQPLDYKLHSMLLQPICKAMQCKASTCLAMQSKASAAMLCNHMIACHTNNRLKRNAKIIHIHTPYINSCLSSDSLSTSQSLCIYFECLSL